MKSGDLVKIRQEPRENEEREIGIILGFLPALDRLTGAEDIVVVYWPTFGMCHHAQELLEIFVKVAVDKKRMQSDTAKRYNKSTRRKYATINDRHTEGQDRR